MHLNDQTSYIDLGNHIQQKLNIPSFLEVLYNFGDRVNWYSKTQSISSVHFHDINTNDFSINID